MKQLLDLEKIKQSSNKFSLVSEKRRNAFLLYLTQALLRKQKEVIAANQKDLTKAKIQRLSSAFIERLRLDENGIKKLIAKLKDLEKLTAGMGKSDEEETNKNDLLLRKVRVPLGVILVIYESRPEVTIDVAALCVKSGNAVILKGGSDALETNKILYDCIVSALEEARLDKETVSLIESKDRRITWRLLKDHKHIDLVIARGGYGLVKSILNRSSIPVLAHAEGGARIYVDKTADLAIAEKIIIDAKTSKPAACNSLDTIVVHRGVGKQFISEITKKLEEDKVKVIGDKKATEKDWGREFLGLTVAIKVVNDVYEAVNFINQHSKRHSEGIIAKDKKVIDYFVDSIDAAALFVNCSTRLHDGYVFGLGSEMGISTGKLHARGPVGLRELTTYKWEVYGNGQIRE